MKNITATPLFNDYTTPQLSLRALGKKYGLSEGAIRKRAKAGGWVREIRYAESTQPNPKESVSLCEESLPQARRNSPRPHSYLEARSAVELNKFGLNNKQTRFVYEYLKDLNQAAAYRRAGYNCSPGSLYAAASRLYRNVKVNRAIQAAMNDRLLSLRLSINDVMHQLWNIVTADPNELTQYRRVNCRECWQDIPWNPTLDPNPDCQCCFGEGVGEIFFCDTRDISLEARSLYAGVKRTPSGVEVLLHDKMLALCLLVKHIGLLQQTEKSLHPVTNDDQLSLSPEIMLHQYKKFLG